MPSTLDQPLAPATDAGAASIAASSQWVGSPAPTLRTAVAGITGYAGAELARILLHHPRLRETAPLFLGREAAPGTAPATTALESLHPQLARGAGQTLPPVHDFSWQLIDQHQPEIVFLALPHEASREQTSAWLDRGVRVIDLSAAWRLEHEPNRRVYKLQDANPARAAALQAEAVYGCPELHRDRIPAARLIANPGCYATSVIIALKPLLTSPDLQVDLDRGIVADCKSGVSGAGKKPTEKTHFMYAADNLSAYAVFGHRHTGELLEQLALTSGQIQFTPHLLPIPRGILSTMYLRLAAPAEPEQIEQCFRSFYAASPLVRVHPTPALPQIQHIVRTPFCDLGFELGPDKRTLVVVSCLDNLLKGASSQAVQNMNLMAGWPEAEGLL